MTLKIGGLYETKYSKENNPNYILINKKLSDGRYLVHDIEIDKFGYDDDIYEATEKELLDLIKDPNECLVGKFKDNTLYAVWDGANKSTIKYLQSKY